MGRSRLAPTRWWRGNRPPPLTGGWWPPRGGHHPPSRPDAGQRVELLPAGPLLHPRPQPVEEQPQTFLEPLVVVSDAAGGGGQGRVPLREVGGGVLLGLALPGGLGLERVAEQEGPERGEHPDRLPGLEPRRDQGRER